MPQHAKVKMQSKNAKYQLDLFTGKKQSPPVRHSSRAHLLTVCNWSDLPFSQKFLFLVVVSAALIPVAVGENEYNVNAMVLRNPYNRGSGTITPIESLNLCHFLFPVQAEVIASDGLPAQGRTVACVQKLEDPLSSKFEQAIIDAAQYLQAGNRMAYLNVLNAWHKKDRKKLRESVHKRIRHSKITPDPRPLINALPEEGLIDNPHQTSTLVSYNKFEGDYLIRLQLNSNIMALDFYLSPTSNLIAYQWLQEFMAIHLIRGGVENIAPTIIKMMRFGVQLPRLSARNAIETSNSDMPASVVVELNNKLMQFLPTREAIVARLMLSLDHSLFAIASWMGQVELVKMCLESSALIDLKLEDWVSSLILARNNHQHEIEKTIQRYLSKRNLLQHVEAEIAAFNYRLPEFQSFSFQKLDLQTSQPTDTTQRTITPSPSRFSNSIFYHRLDDREENTCPVIREQNVNKPLRKARM